MSKIKSFQFWLIIIVLAVLPFHAFLVTSIKIPSLWKELIIFVVFITSLFNIKRIDSLDICILVFFLIGLIHIFFTGRSAIEILYGIKYDYYFLFTFLVIKHIDFSEIQKKIALKTVIGASAISLSISLLIYLFLPENFLVHFGYFSIASNYNGQNAIPFCHYISDTIHCRFQGFFAGPNQLANYLVVIIPIYFYQSIKTEAITIWERIKNFVLNKKDLLINSLWVNRLYIFLFFISLTALYLTYSRSAYISLFIQFVVFLGFISKNRLHYRYFLSLISLTVISVCFLLPIANPKFTDTYIIRKASSVMHYRKGVEGVNLILRHPLGLGLGRAGPASGRIADNYNGLIPENWYIQILLELGLVGGLLFIYILFRILKYFSKHNNDYIKISLFCSLAGVCISSLFLHSFEDSGVSLTLFILLGIFYE